MSKMVAIRIEERLLAGVDQERRAQGLSRARVVHEALALWIARRRLEEAIRREQDAYERIPVRADEFGPILGAQQWPK